jgi:hypothetical protein
MLSVVKRLPLAHIRLTATGLAVLFFTIVARPMGSHWN